MKTLCFSVHLLVGLCFRSYFAYPIEDYPQHASIQNPQITGSSQHTWEAKAPVEEQEQVNTVRVTCHPDSLEILIKADMFGVGAPVNSDELRLGVEHNDYCRATTSSGDEYRILVGLVDCGTERRMTEDTLVYTNLLMYSPVVSPDGVVRMDDAVIPIECQYERKYSVSSSSLVPTWIPFMSTQAAVATLEFDLTIMTNDWRRRSSNVFYLGEPIVIEASVRVGHHMGLRVFVSSCVATLYPDVYSEPRYVFVENGCLVDSELPGSRSHYLSRTQDDKLHLTIDAFKFHNEDRGELYITCHLNAVLPNDADAPNKACSFVNGRWMSADGNDYLCGNCQSHDKASSPGKFGPRGFEKPDDPESFWRSGLGTNSVWEQEARVGPVIVLPAQQNSEPIPVEELPSGLNKISRPSLSGSRWRNGINDQVDEKELLFGSQSTPDEVVVQTLESKQNRDENGGTDLEDGDAVNVSSLLEKESPEIDLASSGTGEQEARMGPMIVLPAQQNSEPIPVEELPPGLNKIGKPSLSGSQWRSGINDTVDEMGLLLRSQSRPDEVVVQTSDSMQTRDEYSGTDLEDEDAVNVSALLEKESPEIDMESNGEMQDEDSMTTLDDVIPTVQFTVDVNTMSNATENALLDANDPMI